MTIKPIHSLVAAVMQGAGEPRLLIEGAASPHTFSMKPSDAKAVNEAALFVRVSEGLEPFTGRLVKALPKSVRVLTLADTPGLTLHALRTGGTFEAHEHEKGKGAHGHAHAHAHTKPKGGAAEMDGHIWLDPANARLIGQHVAEQLAQIAPANAETYRRNAAALAKRLDDLDAELKAGLGKLAGKPYIVFHDAYQYLERRYGLEPVGSVTVSPDVPPSAKRITELRGKITSLKAACVFAEPQFSPKIIDTVVEGTPARKGLLDPLGAAMPAGPDQYFALLRGLARDLASCLAASS